MRKFPESALPMWRPGGGLSTRPLAPPSPPPKFPPLMPPLGEKDPSNFDRAVGCATTSQDTIQKSPVTRRSIQCDDDTTRRLLFYSKQALRIDQSRWSPKLNSLVPRPTIIYIHLATILHCEKIQRRLSLSLRLSGWWIFFLRPISINLSSSLS